MKRVLLIVTIMICSGLWADAQAQTIADMARRERAKRAAAEKQVPQKKAAPITNSQLKPKTPTVQVIDTPVESTETATTSAAAASAPGVAAPITSAAAAAAATAAPESTPTPTATVTAPSTPASATPATPAPAQPSNEPPARDEKWWRQRFETARADVRRAENQVAVAELEFNAANRDFLQTSYDPDGRGPAAVNAAKAKMEAAQKRLTETRAKVVQLEEELRQSGAPAGWAR